MSMIITTIIFIVTLFVILAPTFKNVGEHIYKFFNKIIGGTDE